MRKPEEVTDILKNLNREELSTVFKSVSDIQECLSFISVYGLTSETLFITFLFLKLKPFSQTHPSQFTEMMMVDSIEKTMAAIGLPVSREKVEAYMSFSKNNPDFFHEALEKKMKAYAEKDSCSSILSDISGKGMEEAIETMVEDAKQALKKGLTK